MLDGHDKLTDVEGVVKWFDPKKGYGFIVGPAGQDIFIHFTQIAGSGFRALKDGAKVRYDAELTDKGWHATRCARADLDVTVRPRPGYARSPRR